MSNENPTRRVETPPDWAIELSEQFREFREDQRRNGNKIDALITDFRLVRHEQQILGQRVTVLENRASVTDVRVSALENLENRVSVLADLVTATVQAIKDAEREIQALKAAAHD